MTPHYLTPLDVRTIPPVLRHRTIFELLERLQPGQALPIVNDHDPVPLRRQMQERHPGRYSWTYLLQGPELWQVVIAPTGREAAGCGGEGGSACGCGS